MYESIADKRRGDVSKCPNDRSPELATRQTRPARGRIVNRGPHAARIGEYLADRDEKGKYGGIFET
jgi:hypothetical protein